MWEILQHPEYQHVLLNHIPIVGLAVAAVMLLGLLLLKQRAGIILALILVALTAGSAWPVMATGEAGEDRVQSMLYNEGQAWLHHHEHLAEQWGWIYYVTAVAALVAAAIVLKIDRPRPTRWAGVIVLILCVASLAAGVTIASAGGKMRHAEFRHGPPPSDSAEHTEHD